MSIENGWFLEKNTQWPGQAMGLEVKEVLLQEKTKYQDLMVFQSTTWGKVLILDGVIQLTERDECSYQEMLTHIPMFSATQKPKKVLVVGGGDGGVLREVCKHSCVESVVMCEIDVGVVNASKKYFPSVSCSFSDPRVTLLIQDAVKYVEDCVKDKVMFDCIIVDSSDPVGPAEKLFQPEFYQNCSTILDPNHGVMASQGESLWIHQKLMRAMLHENGVFFRCAEYASVQVPTYPCGQISIFVAAMGQETCKTAGRAVEGLKGSTNYYSERMHSASFVLPAGVERELYRDDEKKTASDM